MHPYSNPYRLVFKNSITYPRLSTASSQNGPAAKVWLCTVLGKLRNPGSGKRSSEASSKDLAIKPADLNHGSITRRERRCLREPDPKAFRASYGNGSSLNSSQKLIRKAKVQLKQAQEKSMSQTSLFPCRLYFSFGRIRWRRFHNSREAKSFSINLD